MPDSIDASSPWLVVTVKPRHEKAVSRHLQSGGIEAFLPLYGATHRWFDRTKTVNIPLFPGYVFCRVSFKDRLSVLGIPGVTQLVTFGARPAIVTEDEIVALRIMISSGQHVSCWPYLRIGERVSIKHGSLAGLCGILVREKGALRVVVTVEMLQTSAAVEVNRDLLSPAED